METIPIDYTTLRLIWWGLLGILLIGFAVMGGMDLGVGALLPAVARTDEERRVLLNMSGPTWEGNQVWLVLGGGAIFAAWPPLYAVSFSGFYLAMIVILLALILRPVGFKFRGKVTDPRWRATWDWALFVGGAVPALIFGVAVGNVLLGAPFRFDPSLRIIYEGNFFGLLMPYALLCGLVSLGMCLTMGASVVAARTAGAVAERARTYGAVSALATALLFVLGGVWTGMIDGYVIAGDPVTDGMSNPLDKEVVTVSGGWLFNYARYPWMAAAPLLGLGGAVTAMLALYRRLHVTAILAAAVSNFGIVSTAGLSLFPFLLPSSADPRASLTVWDSSSSHLTLFIMLIATAIFMPIILAYTTWVFRIMRGPVTTESLSRNPNAY